MRPLAAALCMGKGKFVLDGVPRMRERPIADLIDGLQQLGADITCVEETGRPPVTINANGLKGGKVCIPIRFLESRFLCFCFLFCRKMASFSFFSPTFLFCELMTTVSFFVYSTLLWLFFCFFVFRSVRLMEKCHPNFYRHC